MTYQPIARLCQVLVKGKLDDDAVLKAQVEKSLRDSMEPRQFFAGLCRWTVRAQFGLKL